MVQRAGMMSGLEMVVLTKLQVVELKTLRFLFFSEQNGQD